MSPSIAVKLNALALFAISAVLAGAFYFQFTLHELPCPLCLLQRVAFMAMAVGPILAIRHGPRPAYYGLVILAAALGAMISGRQILLHILPGDAGYGSAILGAHFYTWAFVCFAAGIVAAAIMLLFDAQFERAEARAPEPGPFEKAAVAIVITL